MKSCARITLRSALYASLAVALGACAQRGADGVGHAPSTIAGTISPAVTPRGEDPLVALVDGATITLHALEPALIETAGNQALRDAVLDVRLAKECALQQLEVTDALCENERALLLETLSKNPREADDLLRKLRANRGLGDARFTALLARNAALRLLAARDVAIDDAGMRATFDTMHGAKRIARVAALSDLATAERFLALLAEGRTFNELAAELSTDTSGPRGGLLPPIAQLDPSWPESMRRALFALEAPGSRTPPILDHAQYLVVELVSITPPDGVTFESAQVDVERVLRRSRERLVMDGLARSLSRLDGVTIFDRRFDQTAP